VLVQCLFHLYGVDVLATGNEHVVLAADDGDELGGVPGGEVADVQPSIVEPNGLLLRRVGVGVAALG